VVRGDTIAAIATAPGKGGVAVVRVSGPEALSVAERLTGEPAVVGRVVLRSIRSVGVGKGEGNWLPTSTDSTEYTDSTDVYRSCRQLSKVIDEAVVLTFRGPHSYTGEDVVEFQCHGGSVTPRRVLEACLKAGARLARRGEFTERAFLNGRLDYDQAEAVLDLVNARTDRAADAALEGLSGRSARDYRSFYETALDLSTRVEYALDVDEVELPADFVRGLSAKCEELRAKIAEAIRRANEGRLLREGALVVLAGPPNAGKSSLMNALLETDRAIVSDVPGTTRDSIEEGLNLEGWPIRLTDTAGLRATDDAIESEGVKRSEDLMAKADVVLWLGNEEMERRGGGGQRTNHLPWPLALGPSHAIRIHPKCDLGRGEGLNVSAKTGEGLDALKREIVARLEKRLDATEDPSSDRLAALHAAYAALHEAQDTTHEAQGAKHEALPDLVLVGNALRRVADRLGTLVGAVYSSDLLDNLFSRFCVGK